MYSDGRLYLDEISIYTETTTLKQCHKLISRLGHDVNSWILYSNFHSVLRKITTARAHRSVAKEEQLRNCIVKIITEHYQYTGIQERIFQNFIHASTEYRKVLKTVRIVYENTDVNTLLQSCTLMRKLLNMLNVVTCVQRRSTRIKTSHICYAERQFQLVNVTPDNVKDIVNESKNLYIQDYMLNLKLDVVPVQLSRIYLENHTFVHSDQCLVSSVGNVANFLKLEI